ncbi:glycosyltransferase family 9 protein [Chlorobium phaeovibrioides]|uniref:Glycosyltransferase family 9 protein n=1 Tax=Chlorobium phaeovibrioides TaxID=1094 RepID=A0A5M8IAI9_CHLPH|nr:glycosyltransferase family 9 protein [Chlorobium phaeovibrioides]KAA6232077.1 glycosyltransferase family 9 protein [Chlorobium phaeovibrioides]
MIKPALKLLRAVVLLACDLIVSKSVLKRSNASGVLVVRLDAIGDFVLWLDSAKELRRCFPGKRITLVANASWADLARQFDYWDEVIPASLTGLIKSPLYRWGIIRQIAEVGFAVAVQMQYSRVFLAGDSIIRASGARERIASVGDFSNIRTDQKRISDRWHTQLLQASPAAMMEIDRNAEFMSALTGAPCKAAVPLIPKLLDLPSSLCPSLPYFIVFPGASVPIREWPLEKFASVIDDTVRLTGLIPVLCGSGAEKELCASLSSFCSADCLDYSGRTSLAEFTEVIRGAMFLIGNETSAVHIAAAVQTPSICILGGGHYGRFMPYPDHLDGVKPLVAMSRMDCFNCNWRCVQTENRDEPFPCITGVSVEQVMAMVERILDPSVDHDGQMPAVDANLVKKLGALQ